MQAHRQELWQADPSRDDSGYEHVVIEATQDPGTNGPVDGAGPPLETHYLDSPFHGYTTELSVLAGHYLRVRYSRADGSSGDYVFDLGYLGNGQACIRRIAWAGIVLTLGLIFAGAGAVALAWARQDTWSHPFLAGLAGFLTVVLGLFAAIAVLRRTTETLELHSLHGRVPLARLTGGLGSSRRHSSLVCDLAMSARTARAARPRARRQFLCDEMRVHHGLHQSGVITTEEYEASKARILAAHD